MSPTIPTPESDLRDRLGGALPDSYPSLDLDAVLASGRRTVRRRRVGAVVAGVAAAAVVAVGATQLVAGPPTAAPQPAQTGRPSEQRFSAGSATVAVARGGQPTRTWTVDVSATGDDGMQSFSWRDGSGSIGTFGSAASHDVAVWATPPGSPYMVGLVPDEGAETSSILTSDTTHGDSAYDIVRVPGTGWSAFVIEFAKPFQGADRVNHLLWFDRAGRPVDEVGSVGAVTTVGRDTVWLSPQGITLGVSEDGGLYSTPMDGTDDKSAYGDWPRLTIGGKDGAAVWHTVLRMSSVATKATLVFSDGRRVDVVPVQLGRYSVAVTPIMSGQKPPDLSRVEWTDTVGRQHDDRVPPPSFGTS